MGYKLPHLTTCLDGMKSTKLDTPVFCVFSLCEYKGDKILKGGGYKFEVF